MIRLNSRAGVFALSLATWHGMRIVSPLVSQHLELRLHVQGFATYVALASSRAVRNPLTGCSQITGMQKNHSSKQMLTLPQLPQMKQLKPFLPSLYSEYLLASPSNSHAQTHTDNLLISTELAAAGTAHDGEGDLRGPGGDGKGEYQRGLGETFGFPGDARKMRERSKMRLWREYFLSVFILICMEGEAYL